MTKNYNGKDLNFPINAYRIVSHISFYGYVLEVYKVEFVEYNTETSIWKFRHTGELWKSRPRTGSAFSSQIIETPDLGEFHFDLLSVKNRVKELQSEFKQEIVDWERKNQLQLLKITEELKSNVDDGQLLRRISDQLNEVSFPELKDLYEK